MLFSLYFLLILFISLNLFAKITNYQSILEPQNWQLKNANGERELKWDKMSKWKTIELWNRKNDEKFIWRIRDRKWNMYDTFEIKTDSFLIRSKLLLKLPRDGGWRINRTTNTFSFFLVTKPQISCNKRISNLFRCI
jgi:hypothetical protein